MKTIEVEDFLHRKDERVYVNVQLREVFNEYSQAATIGVWVKNSDSTAKLHDAAVAAALDFMERALADLKS